MPYFTKENAGEMQARGVMARMLFKSPESRRMIARKAAARRWYRKDGDDLERVECLLAFFANEVADYLLKDDHEGAIRTASAMLGWERLKIALRAGGEKNVTPELSQQIEDKLAAARKRRDEALTVESKPAP